jgi:RNA polymerase sigma-70 factor (ECF subfamily)
MHEIDRTAVSRACEGDSDAFRSLVDKHSRYVFQVAYRLTGSAPDAEDVVQETFLKAYRQLSRFEARADFRTWLHRIAVNCAIDLIRGRRHREVGQDPMDLEQGAGEHSVEHAAPSADRMVFSVEVQERLRVAMARLTPQERTAFTLRHMEGMPIKEVATALGLKTEATKNSIFRAVKEMRVAMQPFVEA